MSDGQISAFAKVNLCLFLGPVRGDGRHELVTLFESAGLTDDLIVGPAAGHQDAVVCPDVAGENLVTKAVAELRHVGWDAPAVRVEIVKRIPVAAGLGGGSADAAAMLRAAPRLAPIAAAELARIAAALGADVPSQLQPGPSIGTGAGEVVEQIDDLDRHALLVIPQPFGLATADVFREADRLGLERSSARLAELRTELQAGLPAVPGRLVVNDLQPAALSLRPEIAGALELAEAAGADQAIVCGSGPTVIGIFWGADGFPRADGAAVRLKGRFSGATAVEPVRERDPGPGAERLSRGVGARAPNE
ncbi:MAG TPA: hypothetical protein VGL51_13715 [Solirubrobacteraceae bacterium]